MINGGGSRTIKMMATTTTTTTAVLFDFDGTLGDTETPAMEVAFWELVPFLPSLVGPKGRSICCEVDICGRW